MMRDLIDEALAHVFAAVTLVGLLLIAAAARILGR